MLRTAPCSSCKQLIVFGERRCRGCGLEFDYGARSPPVPTLDQVREALQAAQAAVEWSGPHAAAPAAPSDMAGLLDTGRFDDAPDTRPVVTEDIPGFIDSTLYAKFTPKHVDTVPVDGLQQTVADDMPVAALAPVEGLMATERTDVGPVRTEDIPGFIDSTLYAKFTPKHVDTVPVDGLEANPAAAKFHEGQGKRGDDEEVPCQDCGAPHDRVVCPACGMRRSG